MINKKEESQSFINLGIVMNSKKEVLMIKRKKKEMLDRSSILQWAFPGGKQHLGESRKECVEREVLAETGYQVLALKEISMRIPPELPIIIVYHLCRLQKTKPLGKTSQPWEVAEVRWVKPAEIRNLATSTLDKKVAEELGI